MKIYLPTSRAEWLILVQALLIILIALGMLLGGLAYTYWQYDLCRQTLPDADFWYCVQHAL